MLIPTTGAERGVTELDLSGLFDKENDFDKEKDMPDDLGEYDDQLKELGHHSGVVNETPDDPYRGTLAGLFAQRRVLLDELRAKLRELVQLNEAIEGRAQMVIAGYTGVGRLGRWLMARAWKRIFRCHDVSLSSVLSDMPKGHCADHWECKHEKAVDCDEVSAERLGLSRLQSGGHQPRAAEPFDPSRIKPPPSGTGVVPAPRSAPKTINEFIDKIEVEVEKLSDSLPVPTRAQPTHAPGGGTIKQG